MEDHDVTFLPVLDNNRFVGFITNHQILDSLLLNVWSFYQMLLSFYVSMLCSWPKIVYSKFLCLRETIGIVPGCDSIKWPGDDVLLSKICRPSTQSLSSMFGTLRCYISLSYYRKIPRARGSNRCLRGGLIVPQRGLSAKLQTEVLMLRLTKIVTWCKSRKKSEFARSQIQAFIGLLVLPSS